MSAGTPAPQTHRLKAAALFLFKVTFAALLVGWLWQSGRLDFSQIARVRMGWAFCGLVCFQSAMLGCIALRWHCLTRACGLDFSLRQTLHISLIGNFAAVWTPAGLGLDGTRLWQARRLATQQLPAVIASTFWDRALGVWAILLLTTVSCGILLFVWQSPMDAEVRRALWGVLIVSGALTALPLIARRAFLGFLQRRSPEAANTTPFHTAMWKRAVFFAFATHGCNALALCCALRALEVRESVSALSVLLVAPPIIVSSMVPLTPLGLGVSDATASTLLHWAGTSSGAEATMLGRITFVVISMLCGLA